MDSVNAHLYITLKYTMSDQNQVQSRSGGEKIAVTSIAAMSARG